MVTRQNKRILLSFPSHLGNNSNEWLMESFRISRQDLSWIAEWMSGGETGATQKQYSSAKYVLFSENAEFSRHQVNQISYGFVFCALYPSTSQPSKWTWVTISPQTPWFSGSHNLPIPSSTMIPELQVKEFCLRCVHWNLAQQLWI